MMLQARLHAIQIDPGTYTNEPTGPQQEFNDWFATFLIEEKKAEISELLVANVQVRALYTHLVGRIHGNGRVNCYQCPSSCYIRLVGGSIGKNDCSRLSKQHTSVFSLQTHWMHASLSNSFP